MCCENLVGRNHIGTELLTSELQPMKKLNFGRLANQKNCCVACAVHATIPSNLRVSLGNSLDLHLGLLVFFVRVKDKPPFVG